MAYSLTKLILPRGLAGLVSACSGDVGGFAAYDDLITGPRAEGVTIDFIADPTLGSPQSKSVTTGTNGIYSTSLRTGRYIVDLADPSLDHCPGAAPPGGQVYLVVQAAGPNTANICIDN